MGYSVKVTGLSFNQEDILDFENKSLVLIGPQVTAELDVSGSFEFTIPPGHLYYDMFTSDSIMALTIEVWEDAVMQWFGRPIELNMDFYKNKKIYCEGALGFFNDSVIREAEYEDTQLSVIFAAVIAEHNSMVPESRQFTVGSFTVENDSVYRKFDYEQTSDVLKNKFLDAVEGHFFLRRENGVNYIDFLKDMPYTCNQQVEFAQNLLNFTHSFDGKDFATCVIPLGGNDEATGKHVDIKTVNNNSDILVGNAATNFGQIVKVQNYNDIKDPTKLVEEGTKYLRNLQWNALVIECSAVDLHFTDNTKQQFRVGQKVRCVSNPHWIDMELPISKMILYLDSAVKQITLGQIPKKTLARFYKELTSGSSGTGDEDETPDDWALIPPDTDGGEPTMKKIPVRIQIVELPYQTSYSDTDELQNNEYFDPTGIIVTPLASGLPDLTYFTDSRYIQAPGHDYAIIPMNELSFTYSSNGSQVPLTSSTKVTDIPQAQIMCWVWWTCPYNNQKHGQAFYIYNSDQAALDAENVPDYIRVVGDGGLYGFKHRDGAPINYARLQVKAFKSDGTAWEAPGYPGGMIPISELEIIPTKADINATTVYHVPPPNAEAGTLMASLSHARSVGNPLKFILESGSCYYEAGLSGNNSGFWLLCISEEPFSVYLEAQDWSNHEGSTNGIIYGFPGTYVYERLWTLNPGESGLPSKEQPSRTAWWRQHYSSEGANYQTISVNWKRPDGVTLTTTFKILVVASDYEADQPGWGGR